MFDKSLNIIFTKHAIEQITKRNISQNEITNSIKNDNFIEITKDNNIFKICYKNTTNKDLIVVLRAENKSLNIITSYKRYTKRRKK